MTTAQDRAREFVKEKQGHLWPPLPITEEEKASWLAEFAEMEKAKWQDIATAPKEQRLLLCNVGYWPFIGRFAESREGWLNDSDSMISKPTLWQPLPPTPQPTAE